MDLNLIREQSLKTAYGLRYAVSKALPLLDNVQSAKATDETLNRLLCLYATAACAYGFDHSRARVWLKQEKSWAIGIVPKLDFGKECDSKFVTMLPNLKIEETSHVLRSKIKPRAINEIIATCDIAYYLHWAVRQAHLTGSTSFGKVQLYVIEERHRALEWLLSNHQPDKVPHDT